MVATPTTSKEIFNFKRLEEVPASDSIVTLGYGGAGTGKSWFGGTMGSRTLFISNGNGLATIQGKLFKERYPNVNPIIFVPEVPSLTEPLKSINSIRNGINAALDTMGDEFDAIYLDDSTQARNSVMAEALKFNQDTNRSKTLAELVARKYKSAIPAVQDYGTEMEFTEGFFNELINDICRPEKKHLVVMAHERMTFSKPSSIGEQPKLIKITASFTGVDRNPDYITGLFDNVWHFETLGGGDRVFYNIRTEGDDSLIAKTRNNGLFDVIEKKLDWPTVVRRIKTNTKN